MDLLWYVCGLIEELLASVYQDIIVPRKLWLHIIVMVWSGYLTFCSGRCRPTQGPTSCPINPAAHTSSLHNTFRFITSYQYGYLILGFNLHLYSETFDYTVLKPRCTTSRAYKFTKYAVRSHLWLKCGVIYLCLGWKSRHKNIAIRILCPTNENNGSPNTS